MAMRDGAGQPRSYLATEENFRFLKDLQTRNLVVPVVGNFGGPKALRAIGRYLRDTAATVTAFYVSNVEQYLRQDGLWTALLRERRRRSRSTRAARSSGPLEGGGRGVGAPTAGPGPGMFASDLAQIQADTRTCESASRVRSPR